jgi:hypothetical protein
VTLGLEVGGEDSVGLGEGDGLRFFFFGEALGEESGAGVGEVFFFFGEAVTAGVSAGVGLADAFFFFDGDGDGDFSGVGDGLGVGDFSATSFFFEVVELLRCFRGVGVGVGAKIFLILLPNDSSAGAGAAKFVSIMRPARAANPMANARRLAVIPSEVEEPRGTSSDI